jgi:hypothetical protein
MFDLHQQFVPRGQQEAKFLLTVSDRLSEMVADRDLSAVEAFILQAADQAGLRRLTAVVLVALAKLYEGKQGSPAAKLLKLKDLRDAGADWQGCAYNAVADVRQMEVLSTGVTMPDLVTAMTGDLGLAQVWCGLRPTGVALGDNRVGFHFRLDAGLFPRLQGSTDDLIARIKGTDNNATKG